MKASKKKPSPPRAERYRALAQGYAALSLPQAEVYRDAATVFEGLAAETPTPVVVDEQRDHG
jgi:hypothetical protein